MVLFFIGPLCRIGQASNAGNQWCASRRSQLLYTSHPAHRLRLAQSRKSRVPGSFPPQWNAMQAPAVSVKPALFATSVTASRGDVRPPPACSAVSAVRRAVGRSRLEQRAYAQSKSTAVVDSRFEVQWALTQAFVRRRLSADDGKSGPGRRQPSWTGSETAVGRHGVSRRHWALCSGSTSRHL